MHSNIPGQSTLVCDLEGALLKCSSTFPYFMLVAFEGGGFLRALVLLLFYPLICCLSREAGIKIMVMISFCGLSEEKFRVGRTVLPKYLLEGVGLEGFEVVRRGGRRVCVSSMPRVMVEDFLKDYLEVEVVLGRELKVFGGVYTGFMEEEDFLEHVNELRGEVFVFGSASCKSLWRNYSYNCKNSYMVTEAEKQDWHTLPRSKYPRPLIFHDGRLAFRPTALATLAMFLWSPLGLLVSILRVTAVVLLPYKLSVPVTAGSGMIIRYANPDNTDQSDSTCKGAHHLYICNHRTLLDPLYISGILNKKVSAATYSLSPLSEFLAPIKTFRLTRNKQEDKKRMEEYLKKEDLVVCPEGTTCREPYLLRFSPLFAELTDEIVPVAMLSTVSMFHGTTANGLKWLDPFYFQMNPNPMYEVKFLEKMSTRLTGMEDKENGIYEMANMVQRKIGRVLGFECTAFSRKDKYLLLAGNEGIVDRKSRKLAAANRGL